MRLLKTLLLLTMIYSGAAASTVAFADETPLCTGEQTCDLPYLAGLVMADGRFADVLKSLQAQLGTNGYLVITKFTTTQDGANTYVGFLVEEHVRFGPKQTTVLGQIVGTVIAPPGPGYEVRDVLFKPAPQRPGGISVGNQ